MPLVKSFKVRPWTMLLTLCLFADGIPSLSLANEMLRIAGMGGVRIATSAADAGIFGNPASLVHVQHHTVSAGVEAENIHWAELPKQGTTQFAAEVNIDMSPTFYYSLAYGKWGASAGYAARFANFANFRVESTRAKYDRYSRRFSAITDLWTRYDRYQERRWILGFSREIGKSAAGLRLKLLRQAVHQGTVISSLNLAARHGPEVDITSPEALITAISEELQFGDRIRNITSERQPTFQRTVHQLELDVGFQQQVGFDAKQRHPPLRAGVLFENLLHADLVEPLPFRVGIGVAYQPLAWITVAADISRVVGQPRIGYAVGAEFYKAWQRGYAVACRIGVRSIKTPTHFTAGVAFGLGTLWTEYTLSRALASLPGREAHHLFALTVHL